MAGFSDYLENKVLDYVFSGGSFSQPGTKHVALFTTAPGDDGTGGTECSGTGYARQSVTLSTSGSATTNSGAVEFPTAGSSWGTIVAAGVYDASTSGNLLAFNNLTASKTIGSGDVFRINAGDLDITLD
tara:strand:+ start:98 stop:484 length:387 start_codon:yes stop_codon:yes gene_type:complete